MRFSTIIAATASVFIAQQAGATPSPSNNDIAGAQVVDGHLRLLTADKRDSMHGAGVALPNTRRHHLKKVRRQATGSCRAKSSSGSNNASSSGSSSSSSDDSSNDNNADDSSSSSSSSSKKNNNDWSPSSTSSSQDSQATKEAWSGSDSGSSSKSSGSSSSGDSKSSSSDSSSSDNSSSSSSSSGSSSGGSTGALSAFQGTNSGVGSWFRTNLGSDSTNGMSWCETKYKDDWKCFAPSVGKMMDGYANRQEAAKAYCGAEVIFENPNNGKTATAFICDGFDDTWAKRSGNTDLTVALFEELSGKPFDNNKNTVIMNLSWKLTGSVNEIGTFQKNKYVR